MSILSMLFSHGSFAELFHHLNKSVMMCLRVKVQCANCFDLSRNKSDWHSISIFAGHNRPLPYIVDCASFCQCAGGIIFKSKARTPRLAYTRELNYFDLSRVSLVHRETLFFLFLYLQRTIRQQAQSVCFYSAGQRSVVISVVCTR